MCSTINTTIVVWFTRTSIRVINCITIRIRSVILTWTSRLAERQILYKNKCSKICSKFSIKSNVVSCLSEWTGSTLATSPSNYALSSLKNNNASLTALASTSSMTMFVTYSSSMMNLASQLSA